MTTPDLKSSNLEHVKKQIVDFLNEEIKIMQDIRRSNILKESSLDDQNDAFIDNNKAWINQVFKAKAKNGLLDMLDHFRGYVAGAESHVQSDLFKKFPNEKQEWFRGMLQRAKEIVGVIENL